MNCTYCGGESRVINSRPQKRTNSIWRRRKCLTCNAVFTTSENVDWAGSLRVRRTTELVPFERDVLFLSLYDSLRHKTSAASDAAALTTTIITRLQPFITQATIDREHIVAVALEVLGYFDAAAATHYKAFHDK